MLQEICSDAELFVGGASRFDVKQGVLGNCWLLAAVASLTADDKLLNRVVPPSQCLKGDDYSGETGGEREMSKRTDSSYSYIHMNRERFNCAFGAFLLHKV